MRRSELITAIVTTLRRVVIIGGGYAGVRLARELDADADVTLIDLKEAFFHRVASLRASADEEWTYAPSRTTHFSPAAVSCATRPSA
ncbi:hypothetical protein [Streptomyces sp. Ru62]|uniref:hypothetical protein n=1 Tax=Streptomyces sp. Ru62 TaxID=2080745 RepID=UPI0026A71CAF|nr:hypothetical protein [Streptomyces sp. Ru62]